MNENLTKQVKIKRIEKHEIITCCKNHGNKDCNFDCIVCEYNHEILDKLYNLENRINININNIIIKIGMSFDKPCILFQHENGFAWYYDGEIKDLGRMPKEKAIETFNWSLQVY